MSVVVLIARRGGLQPALAESLRNAWGGGDVNWLSPDEAAEFHVRDVPSHATDIMEDIREGGVDVAVLADVGRRKKLLLADMDSTMIGQECIDELADVAGVGDRVKDITARAMNGELDFEAALTERVSLLKGLPVGVIDEVFESRISFTPGGRTLIATMKATGAKAALVSGGFTQFTSKVAATLGFDSHRANQLIDQDGSLTGDVARPILGQEAKVHALQELSAAQGIALSDVMAVGDGANDLGMLKAAGLGVALHAKPVVASAAPVRVDHGDLTALLYLQGYTHDEFVY